MNRISGLVLAAVLVTGFFLPGTLLSAILLIWLVFGSQTKDFLLSIWHGQSGQISNFWQTKRNRLQKLGSRLGFGFLLLNMLGWILGPGLGRNDEEPHFFSLLLRSVRVEAQTFGVAANDNGPARIVVKVDRNEAQEFDSVFNYDFLSESHPVYVDYGFYNLDLFPDIVLRMPTGDRLVSGFSGKIYPHVSLLTSLFYR